MGIPFYFSSICKDNPDIIKNKVKPNIDYLFLDFNCAIHYCNNYVKKSDTYDEQFHEDILIEKCKKYVDEITSNFTQVDTLYLSIDGVVPYAKMVQQRRRRYLSSWRNEMLKIENWDSNAISPGTTFMKKLNIELSEYTNTRVNKYILSSSENPGEGEAKIFNFIKDNHIIESSIIIYGLDADLIMLSMLIDRNEIYLMRESEFYRYKMDGPFLYLDINKLKYKLCDHIDMICDHKIENKIETYVTLCFLIGNDFLPMLSYLKIKSNSIDFILKSYGKVINNIIEESSLENKEFIFKNKEGNFELNWDLFQHLIKFLSQFEDHEFTKNHNKYYEQFKKCKDKNEEIDFYGITKKPIDKINPNLNGWRSRYYQTLFQNSKVDIICRNYIEGIKWTIDYYFNNTCYTKWFYKFNYSPTIMDLSNFIIVNDVNTIHHLMEKEYVSSEEHLLNILPLSSKHLLNVEQKNKIESFKYAGFYPIQFEIQTYLKYYLHDCIPIIPEILF